MRKMREEYFRSHCPNFNNENSCNFTDIFQCITKTACPLGSAIYKIKETWTGQDELQQANYALKALPKGSEIFQSSIPIQVPKGNRVDGHT